MFTHTLIAVDFSASWPVLKNRIQQLQSWGVEHVTLAHVLSSRYPSIPQQADRGYFSKKLAALADELKLLKLNVSTRIETGEPGATLVTIAQEQKADLMLLGCSGHSQFHKFFLGSTALDVARLCKVPLWLEPINSSSQPTTLSTMLLATDASEAVKGAENLAKKLSQHIKRTLAITVIGDLKDSERELTDMKSHFRHLAESIEGLETETVKGYPTFTIIEASVKANADLIIIGKRGRNQLSEFLLGSTAEAIARGSDCPVLIVPSDYR